MDRNTFDHKASRDARNGAQSGAEAGAELGADIIKLPQDWAALSGAAPLTLVDAYWHALRGDRLVPDRADVDPRGIESALSHAFILERIAPGHARVRIAGSHLTDLMGMEVRGMPLSAVFEPAARPKLQAALRCLFDDPAIQKLSLSSEGRIGKPAIKAQMALYPLRNDLGDVSRALGCLVSEGEIGRAPRRFELTHVRRRALSDEDLRPPQLEPAPSKAGPPAPLVEASEEAAPEPTTTRNRSFGPGTPTKPLQAAEPAAAFKSTAVPWLRVVKDDED